MPSSPVRFGLIGFGAWGKCHAQAIDGAAGAELAAIAARSEETRKAARDAHGQAEIFADYHDLIRREDLEVVVVVLPTHLHHEVGREILSSGKHLLLEKPMALSVQHCEELERLAREKKLLLTVGHEFRLSSLWGKMSEMIRHGLVGEPQYVLVELSRRPFRLGAGGWRYDIERVGSWILEEPIHFFDLARWYLGSGGNPETVFAMANSRQEGHPELQDNFSSMVRFSSGAYAVVTQTLSAFEHHQTVKVAGTKGALWASWSGAMDRTRHPTFSLRAFDGEEVREVPITRITGEVFELEDQVAMMVRAVREGGALATTAEDGKWSVAMCLAAEKSVETGQPVSMSEFIKG